MDIEETELWLIRHGETDWNKNRIFQGHLDTPLNESGQRQALGLLDTLSGVTFAKIYSSDLSRAVQTAQPLAEKRGMEIHTEKKLREIHVGLYEGIPVEEVITENPEWVKRFREGDPTFLIPGGEAMGEFAERICYAVESIATEHQGERVAVFTHGGAIACALRRAYNDPDRRVFLTPNGGVVKLRLKPGGGWRWNWSVIEE
jgi:probable phosphoglycerate mutase